MRAQRGLCGRILCGRIARTRPNLTVHAYDTDEQARHSVAELARLNQVLDRVVIGSRCDHAELCRFFGRRVLVVCDIEGAEETLLDMDKVPALSGFHFLVELHDGPRSTRFTT